MLTLELTARETELLRETLEATRSTLVAEIARADNREFRDMLKSREAMVEVLLAKLAVPLHLREGAQHKPVVR